MLIDTIKSYFGKQAPSRVIDEPTTTQLQKHFELLRHPVELVASLDDSTKAREMSALLSELAQLSEQIRVREDGNDGRKPSFAVARPGETSRIRFAGIPLGYELTSLVLALLHTGGHPPKIEPPVIERILALPGGLHFETYITLSCHNCPDVIQALNLLSVLNPGISHTMIDGNLFKSEIDQHKIDAVPTIYLNGEYFDRGRKTLEEFLAKIVAQHEGRKDSSDNPA
ncbi:MAG: thioredoxin family protein [Betaproteobacteria bacterium]